MATPRRTAAARERANGKYEAILRAAIKVFAGAGFFNSKVADVAREAGVADGTVYLYFKNKDDILVSIFNYYMEEALAAGKARLAETDDPIEKLTRIVHAHLERLGRDRNLAIVFQVELRSSTKFMEQFSATKVAEYLEMIRRRATSRCFSPRAQSQDSFKGVIRCPGRDGYELGPKPKAL